MRKLRITVALIAGLTIGPATSVGAGETGTIPPGVRLFLELDKREYFLGENVLVHLVVENVGAKPFPLNLGGDYRGSPRHLRFSVQATDKQGKGVPDPNPNPNFFGGISYTKELKPGDKHYESLPLLRYRRFDRPGIYRLRVTHDFGWKEKDPTKFPVARATIEFRQPTPKQARQVVEEMYALPRNHGGSAGRKRTPFADFKTLTYPVYLPILSPKARKGDERALEAIGATPGPMATAELVRLLENKNLTAAHKTLQALKTRLPDPQLKKGHRFDQPRRRLVKESWRDKFAPAVRACGRRLLGANDVESLNSGAYVLRCLGKQEDLETLAIALEKAAHQAKALPLQQNAYPQPRGACGDLRRAAGMMIARGVTVKSKPKTAGELLLFLVAFHARAKFRPAGWEGVLTKALRHELPYVREVALDSLPLPLPKALRALLPALLRDRDVAVCIAACRQAERLKAPELRAPVLAVLRNAKEYWLLSAASLAARALGARRECLRLLASRLDEETLGGPLLRDLVHSVLTKTRGYGSRTTLDAATGRACKKAWEGFLARHGKALAEGKRFEVSDPAVPLKELFPGFTFYR